MRGVRPSKVGLLGRAVGRKIRIMSKKTGRASETVISATEAAKNFGEVADRVREAGVAYVVERKGRPIVRIAPVADARCTLHDLARWIADREPVPAEYASVVRGHVKASNRPKVPTARWPR